MNEPVVETEAPNPAPILAVAWMRQAQLNQAADRRTKAFYNIRRWIAWLGVLATLFAILSQQVFSDLATPKPLFPNPYYASVGIAVKGLFIAIPVLASIFAAFAAKFYSNGSWLIYRAGSEELKKEIYFFRTV